MSSNNINVFKEFALAAGSVFVSSAFYYGAVNNWSKYIFFSRIAQAKTVAIAYLRSLVADESSGLESSKEMLVIVHGVTKANSRNAIVSNISRKKCVVLEQTWGSHTSCDRKTSLTIDPFILREGGHEVFINLDGSNHQLPLEVSNSTHKNIRTSGSEYLVQEKFLPVGKTITAVGICSLQDGNLQIKAWKDLPFFLTEQTDVQLEKMLNLAFQKEEYMALSYMMASISVSVFIVFAVPKIAILWKKWKHRKEL